MKCPFRIRRADFVDTISVNGRARDAKITAKTFQYVLDLLEVKKNEFES